MRIRSTYMVTDSYGGSAMNTGHGGDSGEQQPEPKPDDLGSGRRLDLIEGSGIGLHSLQCSDTSGPFVWQDLANVTANSVGAFQYPIHWPADPDHRTVYP